MAWRVQFVHFLPKKSSVIKILGRLGVEWVIPEVPHSTLYSYNVNFLDVVSEGWKANKDTAVTKLNIEIRNITRMRSL